MNPLRVLTLTRYGALGASSRLRQFQYLPALGAAGFHVQIQSLFNDDALLIRYQRGQYRVTDMLAIYARRFRALQGRHDFDIVWIEKEALPWFPLWVEAGLLRGVPYVLDFDDAVFHNYDLHRHAMLRWLLGNRLDRLMANAALVVAGNHYLARRAHLAGAPCVEVMPTVIDLDRYPISINSGCDQSVDQFSIVWIGSPSTARYLKLLERPLQRLSERWPLVLRVIGADVEIPGVMVACVSWSEATEVDAITSCQLGVMPLLDSPWEQGKCGYKLIQYMACGLPVVASPVGFNTEIVEPGVNGFLASSDDEWVEAIEQILTQAHLRQRMGRAGRAMVEADYCIQKTGPRMAELLKKAAKGG